MALRIVSERQRKAIGEFFEQMQEGARTNFEQYASCEPVIGMMRDDDTAVIPIRNILSDKDLASAVLNRTISVAQPLAFVLASEAWMALKDDATQEAYAAKFQGKLSEPAPEGGARPKAGVKEVVMLQCSSATGENFILTADIVRSEGGKPRLEAWVRTATALGQGRFMFDLTPLTERQ
jgi:hypothetical protein